MNIKKQKEQTSKTMEEITHYKEINNRPGEHQTYREKAI